MNRRQFLSSLSRSALVLPFADVLRLGTPPWKRDVVAGQQAPASRPGAQQSYDAKPMPPPPGPASPIAGTPLGVEFVDVATQSGLNAKTIFGGEGKNKYLLETTGCGVAFYDYDQDGWLDIFLVNGWRLEGFPQGAQPSCHLFRNNRDGTFTDVTAKAGVGRSGWGQACCVGDYDNDGWDDLFVTYYGQNVLFHNNGDGTFTDVSAETGIAKYAGKGMGVAIADYDGDGFMDIFVANDNRPNFLFHNLGGKKFEEVALESGVAYTQSGSAISGMGVDFKDVDNDGRPDIWHTAVENESFPLFQNRGDGQFWERTFQMHLLGTRDMSGWGNGIFDFDNDGWKDLFVARGNVLDNVAQFSNRKYEEPNAVFRNLGNGKFQDVSGEAGPDFQKAAAHRGVAFGDIDNDGRIDAVVSVLNGKVKYFHNISKNGNHWILLKLTGKKSNRMALGAQIRITGEDGAKQYNEVTTAVGYACASDSRVHFGLGASKTIREIDIKWPSRIHQVLHNVAADQILAIEEPAQGNP